MNKPNTTPLRTLKETFEQDGYVMIKNFFSQEEIAGLIAEIQATCAAHQSVDKLNVGKLTFNSLIMHKSPRLRAFIAQPKVVDLLTQLMGPNIWARWDQAVEKGPGAVTYPWHQDNSYSKLKDPHYQLWISLTKMTKDNGGIWILPGSHHKILPHTLEGGHQAYHGNTDGSEFISAEIGDIVLFSSLTLHATTPNITNESRWAYVVEYMKMAHVDPYVDEPRLVIAKNGKPHIAYMAKLPSEYYPMNIIKYFNLRESLRSLKRGLKRQLLGAR